MVPEFKQSMISGSKVVKEGKEEELGLEQALIERQSLDKQRNRETKQSPLERETSASIFLRSHSSRAFS